MLDQDNPTTDNSGTVVSPAAGVSPPRGRRAASRPAGPPAAVEPSPAPAESAKAAPAPDDEPGVPAPEAAPARRTRKTAKTARTAKTAQKAAQKVAPTPDEGVEAGAPEGSGEGSGRAIAEETPAPTRRTRRPAKKTGSVPPAGTADDEVAATAPADASTQATTAPGDAPASLFSAFAPDQSALDQPARRRTRKAAARPPEGDDDARPTGGDTTGDDDTTRTSDATRTSDTTVASGTTETTGPAAGSVPLFQPPDPAAAAPRRRTRTRAAAPDVPDETGHAGLAEDTDTVQPETDDTDAGSGDPDDESGSRRRRRRGGRRRRKSGESDSSAAAESDGHDDESAEATDAKPTSRSRSRSGSRSGSGSGSDNEAGDGADDGAGEPGSGEGDAEGEGTSASTRRRRRRRRKGEPEVPSDDDPENTVVRVRDRRPSDEITGVEGSTRLEAKKQRRREGREAGRRRPPILSESEFLARRESVTREMVVRQSGDLIQIAVLEDGVLVEHYVARESQTSLIGNVYLGRVQNVLPSMEAAFVDIGKGRNAVLYAAEVDWLALGFDGRPRKIEDALSSGQSLLAQVTKDPVGHKGARLTGQVSLPGRYLVYVPRGHSNGISRKLPDTERSRLKGLLKDILPADAGVIVRTAAEGASEEQLTRDVSALTARWEDIEKKSSSGQGPKLLYGEPDLMIKVVRDLFNEDFVALTVQGDDAWDNIEAYVKHVAPDLADRLKRYDGDDVFANYRVDEQIAKAVDRKVFLPSGGSLVIDRTEAMTVVDVNTGKFTGSGGNLEETVTRNNLEAAEEVVRQLRLRDIGGIIVIDFIDMVLESNRDLVLRRLVECLGRDRTRHQVAEVTSLGLVQMTRKKIGTGLLEAFGEACETCGGRGVIVHTAPVAVKGEGDGDGRAGKGEGKRRGGRSRASRSDATVDTSRQKSDDTAEATDRPVPEPSQRQDRPGDQAGDGPGDQANHEPTEPTEPTEPSARAGDEHSDQPQPA